VGSISLSAGMGIFFVQNLAISNTESNGVLYAITGQLKVKILDVIR
jgi:hypothetical protein